MFELPKGLTEEEVGDVSGRFAGLGLTSPTGLCLLPSNFLHADKREDLFFAVSAPDLRVLFRQAGVLADSIVPEGVKIPYRDDRDSTLILATLFLGASYLSANPNLLNVALGVMANYVTDYFRGKGGNNRVRCVVHVEKTDKKTEKKTVKKIEYDGDPQEFGKLIEAINKTIK